MTKLTGGIVELKNIHWELKKIDGKAGEEPWIKELSKLRGRELYDNGQRPSFKLPDGDFNEQDEFEARSYHVLAYDQGKIVGAIRLLPIEAPFYSCVSSKITGTIFPSILEEVFKNDKDNLLEMNRLVVDKAYQHLRLGVYLCAFAWAVAERMQYRVFLNANGKDKSARTFYLKHTGGVFFPAYAGPYHSDYYNDSDIYLLYINKSLMSHYFLRQIEFMRNFIPFDLIEDRSEPSLALEQPKEGVL